MCISFGPDGKRIPAHKCILSKASDAFYGMFYGPLAGDSDIELPGRSVDAFKEFLQFFYSDSVELTLDNIIEVIDLTKKYCMSEFLEVCANILATNLKMDDFCWANAWAHFCDLNTLKASCERIICILAEQVSRTNGFLSLESNILVHILELESFVCDERTILDACLHWARNACENKGLNPNQMPNLRIYLKDLLYKIRFGSIVMSQFFEIVGAFGSDLLFSSAEDNHDMMHIHFGRQKVING